MVLKKRFTAIIWLVPSIVGTVSFFLIIQSANGQQVIPLNDLSAFKTTGKTWKIGANATADFGKANDLTVTEGTGILANVPGAGGADLFTNEEYGDIDWSQNVSSSYAL